MDRSHLHLKLLEKYDTAMDFFKAKSKGYQFPIYTSVDIRDSDFKVAPVDANIYPAGFNNICDVDREHAPDILKDYVTKHYGADCQNILLLTEENTKNLFYWDNVSALLTMIEDAGWTCKVGFPIQNTSLSSIMSASGRHIPIARLYYDKAGHLRADEMIPDLMISNNDFTKVYPFLTESTYPLNPPQEMGWHKRKKYDHFAFYNQISTEFCQLMDIDPWIFTVQTNLVTKFAWQDKNSLTQLAQDVEDILEDLKENYKKRQIQQTPFVFIKNNSGTYGMGVVKVTSGEDVLHWNNKTRQKMRRGKGGVAINQMIVQEGISSSIKDDEGLVAEPVIYMIGNELMGGFLRTHGLKSEKDNLNSPGAIFKQLCMTDLKANRHGFPLENIYGTVSRLMQLAICREAVLLKAQF